MEFGKPKRKKALWATIQSPGFRQQHAALRPEATATGGIRYRSQSEAVRISVYLPIAAMFKAANPICQSCEIICRFAKLMRWRENLTEDVHHTRGREGLLLFDIRHWLPVCRKCHNWIRDNPKQARELNLDQNHKL